MEVPAGWARTAVAGLEGLRGDGAVGPRRFAAAADLGFGRIVVSVKDAQNMFAIPI